MQVLLNDGVTKQKYYNTWSPKNPLYFPSLTSEHTLQGYGVKQYARLSDVSSCLCLTKNFS